MRLHHTFSLTEDDTNQLTEREWFSILKFAHYNLEFRWHDDIWTCFNGVPMGSPCGPHIATIGIQSALNERSSIISANTIYYGSYLDDHFGIAISPPDQWIHRIIPTSSQPLLNLKTPNFTHYKKWWSPKYLYLSLI